jgi:hypothetical protein
LIEAAKCLKPAADHNQAMVQVQYSSFLEFGIGGAPRPELACEFYGGASACENSPALRLFGWHLEFGRHICKDLAHAALSDRSAAVMGDVASGAELGFCLKHGLGVEQDLIGSVRYYQGSADQGNENGRRHLSLSLQYGVGCDVDLDEAASIPATPIPPADLVGSLDSFRCLRTLNKAEFHSVRRQKINGKEPNMLEHFESICPSSFVSTVSGLYAAPIGRGRGLVIGAGGSGTVTLEKDPKTGKRLGVKHIRRERESADLIREVESLAKLNHPNVVRIVGRTFRGSLHTTEI